MDPKIFECFKSRLILVQRIKGFPQFKILSENKSNENKVTTSRLDQYKLVADGVARCFMLYTYFISLVSQKVDAQDWKALVKSITSKDDYEKKWSQIIDLGEKIQSALEVESRKRDDPNRPLGKNWISKDAEGLIEALRKYKVASDMIKEEMDPKQIESALEMIDEVMNLIEPYNLSESRIIIPYSIFEAEKRIAPGEGDILKMADTLAAQIINLRISLQQLSQTLPEVKTSADQSESNILDPLAKKIEDYIRSDFRPKENLPVTKQVKQVYASKGWEIENQFQKYMVDAWEDLLSIQKGIEVESNKINDYRKRAYNKYELRNKAQQFIDIANEIVQRIDNNVMKQIKMNFQKTKSEEMLPSGRIEGTVGDLQRRYSATTSGGSSGGGNSDSQQLQNYLKKKYGKN